MSDWEIALNMLKKGQHLNADHPLVVIEDEIARLRAREQELEAALREITQPNTDGAQAAAVARRALELRAEA